jgi:cytochrome c oxidase assembly protein subunit 15
MVLIQGILGGLTVTMLLNPYIVTGHLIGGNLTFALLVYFAWKTFHLNKCPRTFSWVRWSSWSPTTRKIAGMALILTIILISGGKNSTTYSGYSCSAFPGCHSGAPFSIAIPAPDGSPNVPEAFVGQFMPNHFNEWIHMLHRFFAIFGGTWLMFMAWQLRMSSPLSGIRHVGSAILLLIPLEVSVGIVNALYRIPVPVSALHTAVAATLVGLIAYALSESVLLSSESESASTEQITERPARTGVAA